MKMLIVLSIVAMVATVFCPPLPAAETLSVKSAGPDEAMVKAYLEKKRRVIPVHVWSET
jgi:hypothetical protein